MQKLKRVSHVCFGIGGEMDEWVPAMGVSNTLSLTTFQNTKAGLMPNWLAGLGNVAGQISNTTILVAGDSIAYSLDSFNTQSGDQRKLSWPMQFAKLLAASTALNVCTDSFFGYSSPYIASYDPRISLGTAGGSGLPTLGGDLFTLSSPGTTPLQFTPTQNWNTVDVYFWGTGGNGVASVQIGAASAHTVNTNLGNIVSKSTFTDGAAASQALKINWSSGGSVNLIGAVCYDSAKQSINVINTGMPGRTGATQAGFTDPAYYSPGYFGNRGINYFLAPSMVIYEFGLNDMQAGTSAATFQGYVDTVVTGYQGLNADVMLVAPHQIGLANPNSSFANQQTFQQAIQAEALLRGCLFQDMFTQMGSFLQIAAKNQGSSLDTIHLNGSGYSNYAEDSRGLLIL